MIDENNPAGRLYKILSTIKAMPSNLRALDAWATVAQCPQNDREVTLAVLDLYNLSQQVQALIKLHDEANEQLYLKSFQTIDKAFFPLNLSLSIEATQALLTDEALTRLQFCAEALGNDFPENQVIQSQLNEAQEMIDKLIEEIETTELPATLKWMLLEQSYKVKRSISAYHAQGAKGLKEASNCLLGTMIGMDERLKRMDDKVLLTKIGNLIKFLDKMASKALRIKSMSRRIDSLLPKL